MHGGSFADATRGVSGGIYNPLFNAPGQHEPDLPDTGHNPNGTSDSLDPTSPKQKISEGIDTREEDLIAWHNQLNERVVLGLCYGPRPSMEVLKQWIAFNWENENVFPQHIQYLPNNYYLFFFEDASSALQVITKGQWLIKNTPISFFKWHKGFNLRGEKPTKVPIWVDFPNLPVEFYPWLGKLGNSVGKVLGQKSRGGINPKWNPQLLIEVDLSKPTKVNIPITNMSGLLIHELKIVYKNLPNSCYHCFQQGHMIKDCLVKLAKQEAKHPHGETIQPSNQDVQTVKKGASKPLKKKQQQFNPNRNYFGVLLEEVFGPLNVPSEGTKDFPDLAARQDYYFKEAGKDTKAVKDHNQEDSTQMQEAEEDVMQFTKELNAKDNITKEYLASSPVPSTNIQMSLVEEESLPNVLASKSKRKVEKFIDPNRASVALAKPQKDNKK
ncbi:hypothetical protein L7F22_063359 [Adiantum nelumboides]|nr:hypothetical protein [Adiantum nelumboides]